ncbi:hypothetical protein SAMN05216344_1525 [Polaromonas sp. OV174]|nr:hypothetical protein SAMN05216344_1525 [Polaromonas sp. OV174]
MPTRLADGSARHKQTRSLRKPVGYGFLQCEPCAASITDRRESAPQHALHNGYRLQRDEHVGQTHLTGQVKLNGNNVNM